MPAVDLAEPLADPAEAHTDPATLAAVSPPLSGSALLRHARRDRAAARARLRGMSAPAQASLCQELRPGLRSELLMLCDHPEEVVPLLPATELCITMRAGAMSEAAWLLEMATPEQRQACFDLDVWQDDGIDTPRVMEWIDALIEAGRPTLARAIVELDPELWFIALARSADIAIVGRDDEPPDGYFTEDGVVYLRARGDDDFPRLKEIMQTAFSEAQPEYWRMVYGMVYEQETECEEYARRWRAGRLADLGFPDREWAMRVYRPLHSGEVEPVDVTTWHGELSQLALRVTLPSALRGSLLGRALGAIAPGRASEILGYVLGVANAVAVADRLCLSEEESVPAALRKAVAGIDRGLLELARGRDDAPEAVLETTRPLDLFRIGATVDPELRAMGTVPRDLDEACDDDSDDERDGSDGTMQGGDADYGEHRRER